MLGNNVSLTNINVVTIYIFYFHKLQGNNNNMIEKPLFWYGTKMADVH